MTAVEKFRAFVSVKAQSPQSKQVRYLAEAAIKELEEAPRRYGSANQATRDLKLWLTSDEGLYKLSRDTKDVEQLEELTTLLILSMVGEDPPARQRGVDRHV